MTGDILIRGGLVIDGSGRPGEVGDVAVRDGRIAALGRSLPESGAKIIDAAGLAVAPGFIDIKTHSDFTLPINPKAESKVRQGVTTEIVGHCGFSTAPVLPGKLELIRDYLSASAPWLPFRELGFPEYLDAFPAIAVNAGMLVGHHTLRLNVMGMAERPPTRQSWRKWPHCWKRPRGRGARNFDRAVHAARQLCRSRGDRGAVPGAEAP